MILFFLLGLHWSILTLSFPKGVPVTLDKHTLGFDTGGECVSSLIRWETKDTNLDRWLKKKSYVITDATLNEAAQILRLLHIEELRELQTKINEAIVAVQAIIADPKTDHRLGKVGRWGRRQTERDWNVGSCVFFFFKMENKFILWVIARDQTVLSHRLFYDLWSFCSKWLFSVKFSGSKPITLGEKNLILQMFTLVGVCACARV